MGFRKQALTGLLLSGISALQVHAWGAAGHEITATIAQMYLHPSVLPQICALVYPYTPPKDPCHLSVIATWADRIRPFPQYRWAAPFHYVGGLNDWPPSTCIFGEDGWEGKDGVNVLGGIANTTQWLKDGKLGAGEAVKFLIHFLGDLHMPLHLTARERGGNESEHRHLPWLISLTFSQSKFTSTVVSPVASGKPAAPRDFSDPLVIDLHSVWDSRLISNAILDTPRNYTHPLPSPQVEAALRGAIYDPYIRSILWEGLTHEWKDDLEEWITCPTTESQVLTSNEQQLPLGPAVTPDTDVRRWDDDFVCPYHWAKPNAALNCKVTIPPELDWPPNSTDPHPAIELDTPQYAGRIRDQRIVEKLLAQGGIRTAAVLNGLFAVEETRASGSLFIPQA